VTIPRLPPAAKPLDVTITVNEKLLPYLTIWYQRKKNAGETPDQFALRVLKESALNDYLADEGKKAFDQIEVDKNTAIDTLQQDATSLGTEVD